MLFELCSKSADASEEKEPDSLSDSFGYDHTAIGRRNRSFQHDLTVFHETIPISSSVLCFVCTVPMLFSCPSCSRPSKTVEDG